MKRGDLVQFPADWGKTPTPGNTSLVTRVARDGSWVDLVTPYGRKRVPNQGQLKAVTGPLEVIIGRGEA